MKKIIASKDAPAALGPYSQAVQSGNLLFLSGQLGMDPATGELPASVEDQAAQSLRNIRTVLAAAGATPANVCKTTVFLTDMNDFAAVNGVYAELFGDTKPARSCVEVSRLPKDVKVEIEAIANVE